MLDPDWPGCCPGMRVPTRGASRNWRLGGWTVPGRHHVVCRVRLCVTPKHPNPDSVTEGKVTMRPVKPRSEKPVAEQQRDRAKSTLGVAKRVIAPTRHQQLITGRLKVADLDDDEIKHRRGRNAGGNFANMYNAYTPPGLLRSMAAEADRRAIARLREQAPQVSEVMADIAMNPDEDAADRLRAVAMLLDRAWGKVPDKIVISAESTWDELDDVEVQRDDEPEVILGTVLSVRED